MKIIHTADAPEAIGPYSQAVVHKGLVYCSGQIGLVPETSAFAGSDIESQTRQVMKNLSAVLLEAGSGFEKVLKCTIFLTDMSDFETVNGVYATCFPENPPARETVAVRSLPKDAKVEISCVGYV